MLVGVDTKIVRRKPQDVCLFRANAVDNVDELLNAVKRNVRILKEGAETDFFQAKDQPRTTIGPQQVV